MQPSPFFSSARSERRWVNHISNNYTKNFSVDPCVFQVPQSLRDENPQAYTPQVVGLGPFHHLLPEVQEMENQKRTLVKDFLNLTDLQKFIQFVDDAPLTLETMKGRKNVLSTILPHYDRFLDLENTTLMWILAIDGIFLLQFLGEMFEGKSRWEDHRMVADIMMLENQIPLCLLKKLRDALVNSFPLVDPNSAPEDLDLILFNQFKKFCEQQSPLKLCDDPVWSQNAFTTEATHLLDFLYLLIVKNYKPRQGSQKARNEEERILSPIKKILKKASSCVSETAQDIVFAIGQAKAQGLRVPQCINNVSKFLEQLQKTSDLYDKKDEHTRPQQGLANKIDVPSVSQLYQIGDINFARSYGGIRNIFFDAGKNILHLPEIRLSETSEVVLRNLLAYEAAASKPVLEFAEYVDLLCGIIHTESDVKLLKQSGIITGNLLDEEIVRIFNGINKSIQIPDELSEIQRTVQQLSNWFREQEGTVRLANEIKVPSASKLRETGVKFASTAGGKRNILFEEIKCTTLYLPEIELRDTSKGALKKLNAGHVDFMCAIVQDDYDVMLLKNFKIIKGDLSDEEIFEMFNGSNKSIQTQGGQSEIQRTIQELSNLFRQPEETSENILANEIEVPSVSKLDDAGIKFACTDGGSKNFFCLKEKGTKILLEKKGTTLYLPEIKLGDTPEVALRRLGAYEDDYVDFLCSIIKDADDVDLLKKSQIIKGNLPRDKVLEVFDQKRKAIEWPKELTRVQETVHKVNIKFRNLRMVKAYKFIKNLFEVFQLWVKRLFPTLVLLLLIFQSVCETGVCRSQRSGYGAVSRASPFGPEDSEAKLILPRKVLGYDRNLM